MSSLRYQRPMGDVSRRLHGVIRQLDARAKTARDAAMEAEGRGEVPLAASLRGKARGYNEAIVLLAILDQGRPLRRRVPWPRRGSSPPSGSSRSGCRPPPSTAPSCAATRSRSPARSRRRTTSATSPPSGPGMASKSTPTRARCSTPRWSRTAPMARSRPPQPDPQPGIASRYEVVCPSCGEMIHVGDRVYARRGRWLHCSCAPGSDDQ